LAQEKRPAEYGRLLAGISHQVVQRTEDRISPAAGGSANTREVEALGGVQRDEPHWGLRAVFRVLIMRSRSAKSLVGQVSNIPAPGEPYPGGAFSVQFNDASTLQHHGHIIGGLPLDPLLEVAI
jgi:hypothetical protein